MIRERLFNNIVKDSPIELNECLTFFIQAFNLAYFSSNAFIMHCESLYKGTRLKFFKVIRSYIMQSALNRRWLCCGYLSVTH